MVMRLTVPNELGCGRSGALGSSQCVEGHMSAGRPAISHVAGEIHSLGLTDSIGQVGEHSQTLPIKLQRNRVSSQQNTIDSVSFLNNV